MPGGQPTKLTPQLQEEICALISEGNYIEVACGACGIDDMTYYNYIREAKEAIEKPESERSEREVSLIEFLKATKKAHKEAEVKLLSQLQSPLIRDWQRLAWILERTRNERYGQRQGLDLKANEPVKITIETVDKREKKEG